MTHDKCQRLLIVSYWQYYNLASRHAECIRHIACNKVNLPFIVILNVIISSNLLQITANSIDQSYCNTSNQLPLGSVIQNLSLLKHWIILGIALREELVIIYSIQMFLSCKRIQRTSIIFCHLTHPCFKFIN